MIRRHPRFLLLVLILLARAGFACADEPLWAWVKGETAPNYQSIFGSMGVAASANRPGIRSGAVSWTDSSGRVWLFGGMAYYDATYTTLNYFNDLWRCEPASGEWTWIKGSQSPNAQGVYGTQGVAAPVNTPGARSGAVSWRDGSGKLWLFGGFGYDASGYGGNLNDLWRLDPATGKWTWVKGSKGTGDPGVYGTRGVAATANNPPARQYAASWTDAAGRLWLFGGLGRDPFGYWNYYNDMWCYDPATGNWTWMKGSNVTYQGSVYGTQGVEASGNTPGGRYGCAAWTDHAGRLWLLGGCMSSSGPVPALLNDLWRFDPATGNWTWIKGSSTANQGGVYGSRGVAAAGNTPGARVMSVTWLDASGRLWMFGGGGYDSAGQNGGLNDVWRFEPASGNWAWIAGSNTNGPQGVYGTRGVAAPANAPGGRSGSVAWLDAEGDVHLFGGNGYGITASSSGLNDHWRFDPATGEWTWLGGSCAPLQSGCFGTQGDAAAENTPPARSGANSWSDGAGKLWLFGGIGLGSKSFYDTIRNDLWRFNPASGNWTWVKGSQAVRQTGVYGTQGMAAAANTPGARWEAACATDSSGRLWLFGGAGVGAILDDGGELNDLWRFDPASGNWTWLKGSDATNQNGEYGSQGLAAPDNTPGGRYGAAAWIDKSSRFWLFGGMGYDALGIVESTLNDLWRFDPATGAWTWIKGSKSISPRAVYGTKGVAAPANTPGALYGAAAWTDAAGRLWLFGGYGSTSSNSGELNDLWCLDPATGNWTWVSGSAAVDQASVYADQGMASLASAPGGRHNSAAWLDNAGRFWLLGGYGYRYGSSYGSLDDLWCFDPAAGQWIWLKGNNDGYQRSSVYGAPGVAAPENTPGPLRNASAWADAFGRFWLFGGEGCDAAGNWTQLGSLWMLLPNGKSAVSGDAWRWLE